MAFIQWYVIHVYVQLVIIHMKRRDSNFFRLVWKNLIESYYKNDQI